jgi:hypothetical protein
MYITVCNFHNSALSLISAHNDNGHVDCWLPDMKLERSQPRTIVDIERTFSFSSWYPISNVPPSTKEKDRGRGPSVYPTYIAPSIPLSIQLPIPTSILALSLPLSILFSLFYCVGKPWSWDTENLRCREIWSIAERAHLCAGKREQCFLFNSKKITSVFLSELFQEICHLNNHTEI